MTNPYTFDYINPMMSLNSSQNVNSYRKLTMSTYVCNLNCNLKNIKFKYGQTCFINNNSPKVFADFIPLLNYWCHKGWISRFIPTQNQVQWRWPKLIDYLNYNLHGRSNKVFTIVVIMFTQTCPRILEFFSTFNLRRCES